METTREDSATGGKKRYVEPTVTEVLLHPEEAVLGTCKNSSGISGPLQDNCTSPAQCYTILAS